MSSPPHIHPIISIWFYLTLPFCLPHQFLQWCDVGESCHCWISAGNVTNYTMGFQHNLHRLILHSSFPQYYDLTFYNINGTIMRNGEDRLDLKLTKYMACLVIMDGLGCLCWVFKKIADFIIMWFDCIKLYDEINIPLSKSGEEISTLINIIIVFMYCR